MSLADSSPEPVLLLRAIANPKGRMIRQRPLQISVRSDNAPGVGKKLLHRPTFQPAPHRPYPKRSSRRDRRFKDVVIAGTLNNSRLEQPGQLLILFSLDGQLHT